MPKQLSKFPSSTSLAGDDLFGAFLPLPAANDNLWRPFDRDDQFTFDPDLRRFQDPDECRHLFYSERGEYESIFPADLTYSEYDAVYNKLARLSLLLDGADKHLHITEIERAIMNAIGGSGAIHQSRGSGTVPSSSKYQGSVVNVYIANKNGYKHILPSGCVKCVVTVWTKGTFGRDCVRPIESLIDFCDRGLLRVLGRTLRVIQVAAPPVLNSFVNCIAEYRSLKNKEAEITNAKKEVNVKLGGGLNLEKVKGAWKKPLPPEHFISSMDIATASLMEGSASDDNSITEKEKEKEKLEKLSSTNSSPMKPTVSPTVQEIAAKFPTQEPPKRSEEVNDSHTAMDVDFVSSFSASATPPTMNDSSVSTEPVSNDLLSPSDMDLDESPQEVNENPLLALSPDDDNYDEDNDDGILHIHSDKSGKFVEIVSEFSSPVGSAKVTNASKAVPLTEVSPQKLEPAVEPVVAPAAPSTAPTPPVNSVTMEPPAKATGSTGPTKPANKTEQSASFIVPNRLKAAETVPTAYTNEPPTKPTPTKPKTLVFPDEKDSAPNIMDTMPEAAPQGLIRPEFHYERLTDSVINDCLLPLFTQHQALQNSILHTMQQIVMETLVKQCISLPDAVLQNMSNVMPPLPKPLFTSTNNNNINNNNLNSPSIGGNKSMSYAPRNAHLIFYHDHRIVSVISPYFKYRVHSKDDTMNSPSSSPCSNIQCYYGFLLAPHDHLEDIWYTLCRIRRKVYMKKQKQIQLEQQVQRQRMKRSSTNMLNRSQSIDAESSVSKLMRSNSLNETNNSTINNNNNSTLDDPNMMYVDSNYEDDLYENDEDDNAYGQASWIDEEDDEDDNDGSNVDNAMTEKERLENTVLSYLQHATSVVVKLYTDANNCTIDTTASVGGTGAGVNAGNVCSPNSAFCSLTQETMSRNMRGRPGILEYLYIGKYAYPLPTPVVLGNSKSNLPNVNLAANNNANTAANNTNGNTNNNVPAASPTKPLPRSKKDYRDILVTELPVLTLRQIIDYFAENYPMINNNTNANNNHSVSIDNDFNLAEAKFKLTKALCLALSTLHVGENMTHRDLRPETCVIMSDGTLRLSDFNLAKRVLITSMNNSINAFLNSGNSNNSNNVRSSSVYLAPEVVSSLPASTTLTAVDDRFVIVTKAGDIYALGSILYEVFTHGDTFSILHLKKLHHPFFYLQHPDRMPNINTSSTNNIAVTINNFSATTNSTSSSSSSSSYSNILNSNKNNTAIPPGLPPLHPPNSGNTTTIVPINNAGNTLWPPLSHVYLYLHQPWLLHLLYHCLEEDPAQRPNVTQILRHPWFLTFSLNFDVLLVRELNEVLIRDYHAVYDANFVKRLRLLKPIESMLNFMQLDAKSASKILASSSSYGKKDSNTEEDSNSLSSYYYRHHPAGTWVNDMNATQITSFITLGHEYTELLPDMIHFPSVNATTTTNNTSNSSNGDESSVNSPYGAGMDSGSVRLSKSATAAATAGGGTMKRSRSRSSSIERNMSAYGKYTSGKNDGGAGGRGRDRDASRDRGGDRGSERDRDRDRDTDRSHHHGRSSRDYDDGDLYYDDRSYHRGRTDSRDRCRDRDKDADDDYHSHHHPKSYSKATSDVERSYRDDDSEPPTPPPPPRITSSAYSTTASGTTNGSEVLFVPYPLPKLSLFLRFVRNLKTHYHGLEDLQRLMRASKQHVLLPMRALLKTTYAFYHSHYNTSTSTTNKETNEVITSKMGEVLDEYVRFFQQEKLTYDYPADIFTHHPAINWLLPEIWRQSVRQYRQWKKEGEEIEARRQQELSEINVFANL